MLGSNILEIAIGMSFIYLFLSLICSQINEMIASALAMRGRNLFEGIKNLLNDPKFTGLAQQLYNHGLIDGISQSAADPTKPNRFPSYIPAWMFASAVLDLFTSKGAGLSWQAIADQRKAAVEIAKVRFEANPRDPVLQKTLKDAQTALNQIEQTLTKVKDIKEAYNEAEWAAMQVHGLKDLENLQAAKIKLGKVLIMGRLLAAELPDPLGNIQMAVDELPEGHTKQSLRLIIEKTKQSSDGKDRASVLEMLQGNLEKWFEDAMDRVSGWYKRWTQKVILGIAVVLVLLGNVDTFMLTQVLAYNSTLRQALIESSMNAVDSLPEDTEDGTSDSNAAENWLQEARSLGLPIGWRSDTENSYEGQRYPICSDMSPAGCLAGWAYKLVGLLLSVIAIEQGAPFWFDTLKKMGVNPRNVGPAPEKTA